MPQLSQMLLSQIGQNTAGWRPLDTYLAAEKANLQRDQLAKQQGLGQLVSQEYASGAPDKQRMLGALAQVNPLQAMQMSGEFATKGSRGVTGNALLKQDQMKKGSEIYQDVIKLGVEGQAAQKAGDEEGYTRINNEIMAKIAEARSYGRTDIKNPLMTLSKEARDEQAAAIRAGDDAEQDIKFIDEIEVDARTELNEPLMRNYRGSFDAYGTVVSAANAALANPELKPLQTEMIVNLKKISDSSQVMLAELETSLNQSLASKAKRSINKGYSGDFLQPEDMRNLKEAAKALVEWKIKKYNEGFKGAEKRAKNRLKRRNKDASESFDLAEYSGYGLMEFPEQAAAKPAPTPSAPRSKAQQATAINKREAEMDALAKELGL